VLSRRATVVRLRFNTTTRLAVDTSYRAIHGALSHAPDPARRAQSDVAQTTVKDADDGAALVIESGVAFL
jgi:hypothetical protein